MAVKCQKCGAENPEFAIYCGKCAAEIRPRSPSTIENVGNRKARSETRIETILTRNLLRIEENAGKRRQRFLGRYRSSFLKSGSLVFKSESEEVTFSLDEDGHATVTRGRPSGSAIELAGPHKSFLALFDDERNVRPIPDEISVRMADKDIPDEMSQHILKDGIGKMLHWLFE